MKHKLLLRTDGNAEIGYGHVIRTLALGSVLANEFECILFTRYCSKIIEAFSNKLAIKLIELKSEVDHFSEFLRHLSGGEIVVLDNYFFTSVYQEQIKKMGCKLVCIDDLHDKHFYADLVINHSPGIKQTDYSHEVNTKFLLGFNFSLIRESFLKAVPQASNQVSLDKLFISFGGSDPVELILKVVSQLVKLDIFQSFNIVVGDSSKFPDHIWSNLSDPDQIFVHHSLNEAEMIQLIDDSDFALVPSSSILFEVIALKTPFVTGYFADNQKHLSEFFSKNDPSLCVGDFWENRITMRNFSLSFDKYQLLFDMIDGKSLERVKSEILNLT